MNTNQFQKYLLEFQSKNLRSKPWLSDRDPYKIWLLEVVSQQTRMEQAMPYYRSLIETFPSIFDLAKASEDTLFSIWKGLGYYSRARNLHFTARYIANDLNGEFPSRYTELLKLKGVGEYTAAAIASFAFDEKVAVLDGNVHRVLSRVYGIERRIQSSTDKKYFQTIANQLIFEDEPALFNQLMMDLGSDICKPQNPSCYQCPMKSICVAYTKELTKILPPPKIRPILKERFFYCLFIESNGKIYLEKRLENDIWKGLYQGIVQEGNEIDKQFWKEKGIDVSNLDWGEWQTQVLSHQKIYMKIGILKKNLAYTNTMMGFPLSTIGTIPFPRVLSRFWEKNLGLRSV